MLQRLSSESSIDSSRHYTHALSKMEYIKLQGLFSDLAKRSYWWLANNTTRMRQYEEDLAHLHPLTFLECSVLDPYRREELIAIKNRGGLVWNSFIKNLKGKLEQEDGKENLKPHLGEFAKTLKLSKKEVLEDLETKDVDKLISKAISKQSAIVPRKDFTEVFEKLV